ncbi:MAG: DUF4292 domain-containing protein [Melioribacteraceae bacterium]|nr:DUF4292 domain-containing protein [Melioribacteraceae bacterium]
MKQTLIRIVLPVFTLIMFQYCAAPVAKTNEERIIPADRLIKKIEGNRRKIKTFRGTGVINVESSNFSGTANFEVLLKKPDSIKVSIYGPFGIDLAHSIVTKNDFKFYDVMKNRLYQGRSSDNILREIFKVDLSFDDLIDAFSGSVNLTDKLLREPDEYQAGASLYKLSYNEPGGNNKSVFNVNAENLALESFEKLDSDNRIILESTYKDVKLFDDVPVPYKTDVKYTRLNQRLSLEYRNIEINKDINKLTLRLPNDVNVISW